MTTQGLFNMLIRARTNRKLDICDDCSLVAYDEGIEGWEAQVDCMVMIGGEAPDHICAAREEPSIDIWCDCGCSRPWYVRVDWLNRRTIQ